MGDEVTCGLCMGKKRTPKSFDELVATITDLQAQNTRLREALASAELTIERRNRRIDLLDMPANGAAWLDRNRHPKW